MSELSHTRLTKQIWEIRQVTIVSPSRFAVEEREYIEKEKEYWLL